MVPTNPKIVIINLPGSVERREVIIKYLASLGLSGEVFLVINGRQLTEDEIAVVRDTICASNTGSCGAISRTASW